MIDEVLRFALEPENVIDAVATPQVWASEGAAPDSNITQDQI